MMGDRGVRRKCSEAARSTQNLFAEATHGGSRGRAGLKRSHHESPKSQSRPKRFLSDQSVGDVVMPGEERQSGIGASAERRDVWPL